MNANPDNTFSIQYRIESGELTDEFDMVFDADNILLLSDREQQKPEWTDLTFHQCPNCPLDEAATKTCPVAENLVPVVNDFARIYSYETASVTVTTQERTISAETNIEATLGSLMGLIMATSGCPHFTFFRPMARFHLPFSTPTETIFRATSSYLLSQYMLKLRGDNHQFDLQGLADVYAEIQQVNRAFVERLRAACKADGTLNGLVLLDLFAQTLPMAIDGLLQEVNYLFEPFLEQELS